MQGTLPAAAAAAPAAAAAVPAGSPAAAGYLSSADLPELTKILPSPPRPGSAAKAEDLAAFKETRRLKGTPRWDLAIADAREGDIVADMTCALGVELTPQNAPHLFAIIRRLGRDVSRVTNPAKDSYRQLRPFRFVGGSEAICVEDQREGLAKSFSYPSGHATWGWSVGLILAELAPDRAGAVLGRARAFGESRVVCGVHWPSDVAEARTAASSMMAVLHAKAAFAADMAEAKLEVAAVRAGQGVGPGDAKRCEIEAQASAVTPWTR